MHEQRARGLCVVLGLQLFVYMSCQIIRNIGVATEACFSPIPRSVGLQVAKMPRSLKMVVFAQTMMTTDIYKQITLPLRLVHMYAHM